MPVYLSQYPFRAVEKKKSKQSKQKISKAKIQSKNNKSVSGARICSVDMNGKSHEHSQTPLTSFSREIKQKAIFVMTHVGQ